MSNYVIIVLFFLVCLVYWLYEHYGKKTKKEIRSRIKFLKKDIHRIRNNVNYEHEFSATLIEQMETEVEVLLWVLND